MTICSFNANFTERRPADDDTTGYVNTQLAQISGITPNDKLLDAAVRNQASSLATSLWQMLHPEAEATFPDSNWEPGVVDRGVKINDDRSWNNFANHDEFWHQKGTKTYATVSLESFHDTVHGLIGTGNSGKKGHMGNPRFAGVSNIIIGTVHPDMSSV